MESSFAFAGAWVLRSCFVLPLFAATALQAAGPTELVLHTRIYVRLLPPSEETGSLRTQQLLAREIARQALLLAAREEMGMLTCDATLREEPRTDNPLQLLLTVDAFGKRECRISIYRTEGILPGNEPPADRLIWSDDVKVGIFTEAFYSTLSAGCEKLSRTEFPKLLAKLGGQPADPPAEEPQEPGEAIDTDALLAKVDLVSQFVAARVLHRRLQSDPQAKTFQDLVRAYANLGLLTETNWGATSTAFKARALMYAERLSRAHPNHPLNPWTAAYAQAWLGAHKKAQTLLNLATELEDAPAWTRLIEPTYEFDTETLQAIAKEDGEYSKWATLQHAWAFYLMGEERRFGEIGIQAMRVCPGAYGLCHLMIRGQSIGVVRMSVATEWWMLLGQTPASLGATPTLPADAVKIAKTPDRERPASEYWIRILNALRAAPSSGELTWAALAAQFEEQAMLAAAHSLIANYNYSTEQDLLTVAERWEPFVGRHPGRAYLRIAGLRRAGQPAELEEALAGFRFEDPNRWMRHELFQLRRVKNGFGEEIGQAALSSGRYDITCHSMLNYVKTTKVTSSRHKAAIAGLEKLSPKCPLVWSKKIDRLVANDETPDAETLREWETNAGASSLTWLSLAKAYEKLDLREDAIRSFEESIRLSPEYNTFVKLANTYLRFDQEEKYVPTLERYLEHPDHGIGHNNIKRLIANHLIEKDDPAAALPYALGAAEAYSYSGLEVAARTNDLLGNIKDADFWYRELSRSYPSGGGLQWYLLRRRIGSFDLEKPRELGARQIGPPSSWSDKAAAANWWATTYNLLEGDDQKTLELLQVHAEQQKNIFVACFLLSHALKLDEAELVDDALVMLKESVAANDAMEGVTPQWAGRLSNLMHDLVDGKLKEEEGIITRATGYLDDIKIASTDLLKSDRAYFLGAVLENKGFEQAAIACYRWSCLNSKTRYRVTWHLAAAGYQRLAGEPPVYLHPAEEEAAEDSPTNDDKSDSGRDKVSAKLGEQSFPPHRLAPQNVHGQGSPRRVA